MTRNLYHLWSCWALTHFLISGLVWSWGPQTGELIYCLLNLKFFFHSRSYLHQAVTPATLTPREGSKWLLLSATGPECCLGQPISLGRMILVHRGLFVDRPGREHSQWGPSWNHSSAIPSLYLFEIHPGPQTSEAQDTGRWEDQGECALANLTREKESPLLTLT